jgi:hypothetical protein
VNRGAGLTPAPEGTRPPADGRGRPKEAPNKLTTDVKGMILAALQGGVGGQAYLEDRRRKTRLPSMPVTLSRAILSMNSCYRDREHSGVFLRVRTALRDELTAGNAARLRPVQVSVRRQCQPPPREGNRGPNARLHLEQISDAEGTESEQRYTSRETRCLRQPQG